MNYFDETITSLHQKLVTKQISNAELAQATLDNIDKTNDTINSFISVNTSIGQEPAFEIAADQPLQGIPLAIKDNILTKDLKTTAASKMLANFRPIYEATVVDRALRAGMVNIGKTNLDEFAMGSSTETSYFGATKNPWNLNKVPGGSSGGSAAAVASGQVIAALGTDTGGSVRQPASFNGVFGIKPTYGRVSRWGVIAFSSSLDQVGILSRHVVDSAQILEAISGYDKHDDTTSTQEVPAFSKIKADVKGLRVAVPEEFMGYGVDPKVKEQVQKAINTLQQQGAVVESVQLPHAQYAVQVYYIIASSEASSNLQRYDGIRYGYRADDVHNLEDVYIKSRSEGFGDEVKRRIMLGSFALSAGYFDAYFNKAAQVRTLIIEDFKKIFADYDLVVGPTAPTTAFDLNSRIDDPVVMYMNDILTIPANLAGLPAASVPVGLADNMPVGLQLIAPPFAEQTIFNAAQVLENESNFLQMQPKMGGQK
ncbi:Asp-tRNA(Asn)/Glu-tRNA(Gln) amidotransferase subunit GatA [Bombilactobacillus thymidiniphilus]|uniref:Glutamyl-tRNA(Gln) amidotransferase subunit A n=1 Tax=Bombilactobacillus thymidiniphilus TaxID=2923363 RepID=A0ABY4PCJ5_9LACO|nr:Asp-tRNA(Asn)/Glu-tRNA(Gln) amidotransferase subunit GatA [Bombilactobacillus thymidiniphilus]UQS83236.1 Asp-tRNA(Asn)/Glu-tRNA(Gln) amidotransferase subunit GatA [Bombilactobacillus thymidiniphilus]